MFRLLKRPIPDNFLFLFLEKQLQDFLSIFLGFFVHFLYFYINFSYCNSVDCAFLFNENVDILNQCCFAYCRNISLFLSLMICTDLFPLIFKLCCYCLIGLSIFGVWRCLCLLTFSSISTSFCNKICVYIS